MKLLKLEADDYRSLHKESITLGDLNLFIGANAAGKSTVLDALRFLHDGVQARDFHGPVYTRGGIVNLAWKGDEADSIGLAVHLHDGHHTYEWSIPSSEQATSSTSKNTYTSSKTADHRPLC